VRPNAVVGKLNDEINKALAAPALRDAILNLSAQPKGGTPEDLATRISAEVSKWACVVRDSGTKVY
jgi:tripartite-type tricarboxylate transporter receptor subunit TctC